MRPGYLTLTPAVVHRLAREALAATLGGNGFGRSVTAAQLLDLLLLVAATARTLFAVVTRHFPFSHETARQAVRRHLPAADALRERLTDALHAVAAFTRRDRRRRWTVALDTHYVPFYGDRSTAGVIGGPRKAGTQFFHAYATAVLLHRRRRYTVGLTPVTRGLKPHRIVQILLDPVAGRGLRVAAVSRDAGLDRGDTLLLLQQRGHSYVVPLRRKGNGRNRRNDCFARPSGTLATVGWRTATGGRAVSTRVLVWQRAGQTTPRVYAFGGWGRGSEVRRAWRARRRYRERLGIETSYRQKNQARGWTTSGQAEYRLLLEGLALVLRQVWAALALRIAQRRTFTPTVWVAELTLADVLDWLSDELRRRHPATRRIRLPLPPVTTRPTR